MRVTEATNRDAAAEVEIFFPRDIKKMAACSVLEHEVEASVARHDVFAKQLAHRLELVPHNRWRRWKNFLHRAELNRRDAKTRSEKFIKQFPCRYLHR